MSRGIAILGSTGSIGRNALRVIDALGPDYVVAGLSAHRSIDLLAEQVRCYRPALVAVSDDDYAERLAALLDGWDARILVGPESLVEMAQSDRVDTVLTAVVGAAGLPSVLAAARCGKRLAIANKEPLVVAGELLTRIARENGSLLLPVDSEHSAVFQAMQSGQPSEIRRILLTGSGGPFRGASPQDLEQVTREQALSHPVWRMGPKITIDSATMMNKALEVIEARWLFDVPVDKIEVLIHPESIVHSLVEFVDGSVVAQLGEPDMCLPIQYALTYPKRVAGISRPLRLEEIGKLHFERPEPGTFRALTLAYEVARAGGTAPAVFNAANEAAVEAFLAGRIRFVRIMELIEHCLDVHEVSPATTLEELLEADAWARAQVRDRLGHEMHDARPVR
ncbi:MAG TPA: 1-deoxy-D-xylulose-5-phosphate reductoisomerase [Sedimentisphaerales bacterium]|nr:1-deoxy-D-xylulose-5-phosphate reductoisomerase [Sedimentisphaerales bacterium]HRS12252.1 1-deoxy-D-xylulose-5-phosphate reductoisomerase [Sedimentisphaerales bacterium]HRV48841.1 1-deoxy-D-xylulose-5-phosphate reductoisomerase [Sedimentisphaerales bacterium]